MSESSVMPGALQREPGCGQSTQVPSASACRNRPASQRQLPSSVEANCNVVECSGHEIHTPMVDARVALDHVPWAHGIASPTLHHMPWAQSLHSVGRVRPVALPTVPAGHGVGTELPLAHHAFLGHVAHNPLALLK